MNEYMTRFGLRRLPWGTLFVGGHLTFTTSSRERAERAELGETAIRALCALGVSLEGLAEINALEEGEDLKLAVETLISEGL
jgi:hypothetical protein